MLKKKKKLAYIYYVDTVFFLVLRCDTIPNNCILVL